MPSFSFLAKFICNSVIPVTEGLQFAQAALAMLKYKRPWVAMAVSYTHLDVYKRQEQGLLCPGPNSRKTL